MSATHPDRWFMLSAALLLGCGVAAAQGTKLWKIDGPEQMERGTAQGTTISTDGVLAAGPATALLWSAEANLVWTVAAGPDGAVYAGLGGTTAGAAAVVRIDSGGSAKTLFKGQELGVQALRVAPDGSLLAATSPNGKVYRLPAGGGTPTVLFDSSAVPEKPKYLWDLAVSRGGEVFVATGAPAAVYRIAPGSSKPELLFRTADSNVRCLLLAENGTLFAGTDDSGVIYRVDTRTDTHTAGAKPFALYAAPKREITGLAIAPDGTLFAAGTGERSAPVASGLAPLPVTGNTGISVTFLQPGTATGASRTPVVPGGSEIYRIAPDGTPETLAALKEDVAYALTLWNGRLLVATGNRGRVYEVETSPARRGSYTDVAQLGAMQVLAFARRGSGVVAGTGNSGKLFTLADQPAAHPVYTSEVFDAGVAATWGRVEVDPAAPGAKLLLRGGNVPNPVEGWGDWTAVSPATATAKLPVSRYLQWKAELPAGARLRSVGVNYLTRNLPPVVDEVVVVPGARVATNPAPVTPATIQVVLPSHNSIAQAISLAGETGSAPLSAQKDRTATTVRWSAHDGNGDDLMFSVWFRGEDETNWHLLKDHLSERFFSFDTASLPDGQYRLRVVASDAPNHVDRDTLTGERSSAPFTIDTAPPVLGQVTATVVAGMPQHGAGQIPNQIHAQFEAHDATSPIAHAEFSVDAGPWQYLEPVGRISDSRDERYDFTAVIPSPAPGVAAPADPAQHLLAVRVYDRYENMASTKLVVR